MKLNLVKLLLVAVGFSGVLSGCATQAQRQFQAIATGNKASNEQFDTCVTALYNSPENAPIRPHTPMKITDLTLQQLADQTLATPDEIQAISVIHPKTQECRKGFLAGRMQSQPSLVPIMVAFYNKNDDDLLALTQHKLTWGEYVKRRRDRTVELQVAVQTATQQVVSELNQEHRAEMAQRQRAADALAAWAQTEQMINAANRPVVTNCTGGIGNSVNCVSR